MKKDAANPLPLLLAASAVSAVSVFLLFRKRQSAINSGSDSGGTGGEEKKCIYLDYNGTTPIHAEVYEAMIPYFTKHFGNPGSNHCLGDQPRKAVAEARLTILEALFGTVSSPQASIVFCACGTEADNLAIHLALHQQHATSNTSSHIVTTNVEHPAVANMLEHYERQGICTVTYVPVEQDGCVMTSKVMAAIRSNTALVAIMLANNESGALQPVKEIAQECRKRNILVFTDAAQAVGKVDLKAIDADMVAIVGHKIGAPKGIACLYIRPGALNQAPVPLLHGGGQEFGLRSGTENVPYIVGLAIAVERSARNLSSNARHMEALRHRLLMRLKLGLGDDAVVVHGPADPTKRLPNTLSVAFRAVVSSERKNDPEKELESISSAKILLAIRDQVAASAGSTCHQAGSSSVLGAMGIPPDLAKATIRLSVGPYTTIDEIDRAAAILVKTVRSQS